MKIAQFLTLALAVSYASSEAAVIAIADTPIELAHDMLYKRISFNPKERPFMMGVIDPTTYLDIVCPPKNSEAFYCRRNRLEADMLELSNDLDKNGYAGDWAGYNVGLKNNFTMPDLFKIEQGDVQLQIINCGYLSELSSTNATLTAAQQSELDKCADTTNMEVAIDFFLRASHGSHVSGIATSLSDKHTILPVPFIEESEEATDAELVDFIKAVKAPVVNCSFGSELKYNEPLLLENRKLYESAPGSLFVLAAGNESIDLNKKEKMELPGSINAKNTISVAAVNAKGELASFSNYGKDFVDVAAPGVLIKSAGLENRVVYESGTSQAAPYVSGVAGMLFDACPAKYTPELAKKVMMDTVDKKIWLISKIKSGGIVNAQNAVAAMKKICELKSFNSLSDELVESVTKKFQSKMDMNVPVISPRERQMEKIFNSDKATFRKLEN